MLPYRAGLRCCAQLLYFFTALHGMTMQSAAGLNHKIRSVFALNVFRVVYLLRARSVQLRDRHFNITLTDVGDTQVA